MQELISMECSLRAGGVLSQDQLVEIRDRILGLTPDGDVASALQAVDSRSDLEQRDKDRLARCVAWIQSDRCPLSEQIKSMVEVVDGSEHIN